MNLPVTPAVNPHYALVGGEEAVGRIVDTF